MKYLGKITDNKDLVTKEYVDTADVQIISAIATKQDMLVSGTNIKTINNQSLLGSGNIAIGGGGSVTPMTDQEIEDAVNNGWSAYPPTPAGNAVTISLTNPIGEASAFSSCYIEQADQVVDWGDRERIGGIDSPTGSTTVTVESEYIFISISSSFGDTFAAVTPTITGDITFVRNVSDGARAYAVASSGTITFDGINYDD